ncbi:MAG: hypothetical protein DI539_10740 [Flavobacterium psychrophilum]|nr:MAG: hypothetical protein DI539_10740 [Flavobacterium psychrophilum]
MKLSEKIETYKRQLADNLNRASERFTLQSKKRFLALLGIILGGICLSMMIEPFRKPFNNMNMIPAAQRAPVVIVPPGNGESLLSPQDYKTLLEFKQTMDSLKINDRISYDEILQGREGLLDSINFLISIYH